MSGVSYFFPSIFYKYIYYLILNFWSDYKNNVLFVKFRKHEKEKSDNFLSFYHSTINICHIYSQPLRGGFYFSKIVVLFDLVHDDHLLRSLVENLVASL